MLDNYKELTPILYGDHAIKHLHSVIPFAGQGFFRHWHDRIELLYLESGKIRIYLGDEQVLLHPGELAVCSPRVLHAGEYLEDSSSAHVLMFDVEKFFNGSAASEKYLEPICRGDAAFFGAVSDPEVVGKFKELCDAVENQIHALYTVGLVYQLLSLLCQNCVSSRVIHSVDHRFAEVLDYVNGHYVEKLSAQGISRRFSYNTSYFCRRFKEITGMTVTDYIQTLRVERAERLLETTEISAAEIAWQCGFSDAPHFSRCFKKHTGMTPRQFRKRTER